MFPGIHHRAVARPPRGPAWTARGVPARARGIGTRAGKQARSGGLVAEGEASSVGLGATPRATSTTQALEIARYRVG